jgi:hypothetical protein
VIDPSNHCTRDMFPFLPIAESWMVLGVSNKGLAWKMVRVFSHLSSSLTKVCNAAAIG